MEKQKIKYINNNKLLGIEYDWKLIRKEFKKLKTPKELYNPCCEPLENSSYFMDLSMRSVGKTNQCILLGLVMNQLYETQILLLRQTEEMTKPMNCKEMLNVLTDPDFDYISKLTEGKYNYVYVFGKRWYYALFDYEQEKIIEKADRPFMIMHSIDKPDVNKSSFNFPRGDIVIYDEFIGKYYHKNEFINYQHILSTIIRKRQCPKVFMLANAIDRNSPYFEEMGIRKEVHKLSDGHDIQLVTRLGTPVHVRFIDADKTPERLEVNRLFFGFDNPQMASIVGGGWAFNDYPHIPEGDRGQLLFNNIYVKHSGEYLHLCIYNNEKMGIYVTCTRGISPKPDACIFTSSVPQKANEVFGFGYADNHKMLWKLYNRRKFFYSTNEAGDLLDAYFKSVKQEYMI